MSPLADLPSAVNVTLVVVLHVTPFVVCVQFVSRAVQPSCVIASHVSGGPGHRAVAPDVQDLIRGGGPYP